MDFEQFTMIERGMHLIFLTALSNLVLTIYLCIKQKRKI